MKAITAFVRALIVSVTLLAALIWLLGTSAPVMAWLMRRTAAPETTGLPSAQVEPLCETLCAYLRGQADSCQFTWTGENGAVYVAFHDYELSHLADCLGLFRLAFWVAVGGLILTAVLTPASLGQRGASQAGYALALLAVLGLAGWGVVDFQSLFITFHRVSFTNMGWLLDPKTDLLIRLMPTAFFVWYAALIGGAWALLLAGRLMLGRALGRSRKKREPQA